MKKTIAILLAALMLIAAFAACGDKTTSGTTGGTTGGTTSSGTTSGGTTSGGTTSGGTTGGTTGTTTPEPVKEEPYGTFRQYVTKSAATANTWVDTDIPASRVRGWACSWLWSTRPTEDGLHYEDYCELAEDFPKKMDDEGKVWQFTYKKGLVWANGDPINADTYIYSLKQFIDPIQLNVSAASFSATSSNFKLLNADKYRKGECTWEEVGVKKIDDYTIEFTGEFGAPMKNFMSYADIWLVYEPLYEQYMAADKATTLYATSKESWMSYGPFMIDEWLPDAKWTFVRNPNYICYDDIHIERVEVIYVPTSETRMQLFLAGELDYIELSYTDWGQFEEDPRVYDYWQHSLVYMFVNHGNPTNNNLLGKLNLRRAIYYATDRYKLADTIGEGVLPATRFVRKCVIGNNVTGKLYRDYDAPFVKTAEESFDPVLANKYVDKAFEECGITSASLTMIQQESPLYIKIPNEVQQKTWEEVFGDKLKMILQIVPSTTNLRKWDPNNPTSYEITVGYVQPSATDPRGFFNFWQGKYSPPRTSWNDPEYDSLYEKAKKLDLYDEQQAEEIVQLCLKMEEIALNDLLHIPLYELPTKVMYSEKIELPVKEYIIGYGFGEKYMRIKK